MLSINLNESTQTYIFLYFYIINLPSMIATQLLHGVGENIMTPCNTLLIDYGRQVYYWKIIENIRLCIHDWHDFCKPLGLNIGWYLNHVCCYVHSLQPFLLVEEPLIPSSSYYEGTEVESDINVWDQTSDLRCLRWDILFMDNPDWNVGVIDCRIRWHDPRLRGFDTRRKGTWDG